MMRRCVGLVAAAILLLAAGQALAQGTDTSIDVQNYRPSPGPGNYLGVIGSDVAPHVQIGFNLDCNFQSKPLVFEREDGTVSKAVDYQATLDFLWALGLFNVLQIGVALPVVIAQDGDGLAIVSEDATKLSTTAIRDLRLHLKGRLLGGGKLGGGKGGTEKDGPGLALAITMSVPTGNDENFAGDKNVTVDPVLVFDYRIKVFRFALNAGVRIRQMSKVADFDLGHQLLYGAGLGLMLVGKRLHIMAEFEGAYGLNGDTETSYRLPMEARAGVGWAFGKGKDLHLIVGAGMGFGQTPTVPEYRILASLRYAPVNRDADGDGVVDRDDLCPSDPEDRDEFDDADGCPDPDNDDDGIEDGEDECPDEAEDEDGFEDEDGCPDEDNDGDGIEDAEDGCPDEAEDEDGFEDEDGCPDHDNDGDGVADAQDQCPDKAEVFNGIKDDDGCPDKGKALVIIEKDQIKITQQIKFKKDSAEIKAGKSLDILDVVAAILDAAPHISVEVQGHTDDTGTHEHNMKLSQERAESVVAYLVENGVDPERLVAKGYGPDEPIADNATKKGKKENRRVEFHVIDTAAATAKEEPPPADAPEPPPEEAPQPDAAPAPNKAPEPEYPE